MYCGTCRDCDGGCDYENIVPICDVCSSPIQPGRTAIFTAARVIEPNTWPNIDLTEQFAGVWRHLECKADDPYIPRPKQARKKPDGVINNPLVCLCKATMRRETTWGENNSKGEPVAKDLWLCGSCSRAAIVSYGADAEGAAQWFSHEKVVVL